MSQTLRTHSGTEIDIQLDHPNRSNLEQLKDYFRRKIHGSMSPLVKNALYRTRESIFQIVGLILTELHSEVQDGSVQIDLIPNCIFPNGEQDPSQSLIEIFSRSRKNYLQHPDILLKDLGIYEAYYQIHLPREDDGVQTTIGKHNNLDFTTALNSVLEMHGLDSRYISLFGIRKNGVVYYIGNSSELGNMAYIITDEVQRYYDDLQEITIAG